MNGGAAEPPGPDAPPATAAPPVPPTSPPPPVPLALTRACVLAFVTAFATLALQVLVHRIVSAKLLNNYAFLVISLTMLGFAAAGVALSFLQDRVLRNLPDTAVVCATGFAATAILATALFNGATAEAPYGLPIAAFALAFLRWMPFALLFALPFGFAGFLLGALLAAPHLRARKVYFFDLLGSALGAAAVLPVLTVLGAEGALVAVAVLLLAASLVVAPPAGRAARIAGAVAAALLVAAFFGRDRLFAIYYPEGSILAQTRRPASGVVLEHVAWDPLARIEVSRIPPPDPQDTLFLPLIGQNRAFLARFEKMLTQNNYAYTFAVRYDGTPDSLQGIEETLYAAAYAPGRGPGARVAVIGVGGGFDVLAALRFGAREIVGVEVNGATLRILTETYREYFRPWVDDPRVRLVHGDGRHVLATEHRPFDVIQLSGVDSYSGTPAAAHVFSESYLYTSEAFDLFLRRLAPGGILHVMRLEYVPPREMLRALVTAVAALRRAGVERPEEHLVLLTALRGNLVSMLVKREPFTEDEVERLRAWAEGRPGFAVSAAPRRNEPPRNAHQAFLTLRDPRLEQIFVARYPFDIAEAADDQPFFFRSTRFEHLWSQDPQLRGSAPVMESSLLLLLAVVGTAAVVVVGLPLRSLHLRAARRPGLWRYGAFFAATGVGYLALEVALLQKFGLFLGHPSYALSVVLAALLFFTGLGASYCEDIVGRLGGLRFAAYALAAVVLAQQLLVLPQLPAWVDLAFPLRVALVFVLVAPIGLLLGVFLPTVLERLKAEAPAFVPWAWGINGIFSVLAPILSVAFSMTFGISALLVCALPVYLVAAWLVDGSF